MSKESRKKRREGKKNARAVNKANRKGAGLLQTRAKRIGREQDRADRESEAEIKLNLMKEQAAMAEESRLARVQEAEDRAAEVAAGNTGVAGGLSDIQSIKATRYLQKRGVKPFRDPALKAAQVLDERGEQIRERMEPEIEEINNDVSIPEEERADWYPEEDDIHEEILDEEFDQANFDGYDENHADYLDADTVGVLFNMGKAAADKYRQKQFAAGKKAFGKTKAQWEAEQKNTDTVVNAATEAAEAEIKKQKIKEYTPHMVVGVVLLAIVLYAVYAQGKKS